MSQQNNIDQERYFSDPEYRRQIAQESGNRSTLASGLKQALIVVGSTIVIGLVIISTYGFILFQGLPSIDQLENPDTAIASEVEAETELCWINISLKIGHGLDTKTFHPTLFMPLSLRKITVFTITGEWTCLGP